MSGAKISQLHDLLEGLMPMEIDDLKLLHIWTEVQLGRGTHGGFLRNFAEAWIRADDLNREILRLAALELVAKYRLDKYLDTLGAHSTPSGIERQP